jgi:hypothetical protein
MSRVAKPTSGGPSPETAPGGEAIEQDASVVRLDDEAPAVVHGGGEAIAHVVGHGRDRRGALLVATTQRRRCEQREKREAETT